MIVKFTSFMIKYEICPCKSELKIKITGLDQIGISPLSDHVFKYTMSVRISKKEFPVNIGLTCFGP